MKKLLKFLIVTLILDNNVQASGSLVPTPLFRVFHKFEYFIKAEVIGKYIEIDSLGNNKVSLVLLVKESFTKEIEDDTICLKPIEFNNAEIYYDNFQGVFMDIKLNSTYYFGLGKEYYLSPYLSYNKIGIIDNYLNYRCFTKIDQLLIRKIGLYRGRKMDTEKFERKIRKRITR